MLPPFSTAITEELIMVAILKIISEAEYLQFKSSHKHTNPLAVMEISTITSARAINLLPLN